MRFYVKPSNYVLNKINILQKSIPLHEHFALKFRVHSSYLIFLKHVFLGFITPLEFYFPDLKTHLTFSPSIYYMQI